jgi:CRP/FNR family transcriptional regulator
MAITVHAFRTACSNCNLRELCLPVGLSADELQRLDGLVATRKRVRKGETLFRSADPFTALYAVRSGFFRTSVLTEDGRDQVTGFHMAGEIMGLDGIVDEKHSCSASALEDSEVCILPFSEIEQLSRDFPALQHHVHRMMSREIVRDQGLMLLLGSMRAEERLASFLLNLAQRLKARGFSSKEMLLRMTREEIGSYLGMKLETVSRTFSRFHQSGLIDINNKQLRILDVERLRQIATGAGSD